MEQNRDVYAVPGNVTNKGSWGPNTLIKQGAKLTATWEDVWEDLPSQIRLQLEDELAGGAEGAPNESKPSGAASLFAEQPMGNNERLVFNRLRHDEALQLDELMEQMEAELASAEIFTALFELELSGKVKSLPGKNYVRSF
jgi:DNA processing protein